MDLTAAMTAAQLSTAMNEIVGAHDRVLIMLNPEHYGRGLNMQVGAWEGCFCIGCALLACFTLCTFCSQYVSNIVIMHATGNETLKQWIGRGYRIGRTGGLDVDIILNEGEADELIQEWGHSADKRVQTPAVPPNSVHSVVSPHSTHSLAME